MVQRKELISQATTAIEEKKGGDKAAAASSEIEPVLLAI